MAKNNKYKSESGSTNVEEVTLPTIKESKSFEVPSETPSEKIQEKINKEKATEAIPNMFIHPVGEHKVCFSYYSDGIFNTHSLTKGKCVEIPDTAQIRSQLSIYINKNIIKIL